MATTAKKMAQGERKSIQHTFLFDMDSIGLQAVFTRNNFLAMLAGADWPENSRRQKVGRDRQGVCGVTRARHKRLERPGQSVELGAIWGDEPHSILASLGGAISRSGAC